MLCPMVVQLQKEAHDVTCRAGKTGANEEMGL
jgi:hypothetical protein